MAFLSILLYKGVDFLRITNCPAQYYRGLYEARYLKFSVHSIVPFLISERLLPPLVAGFGLSGPYVLLLF